MYDYDYSTIDPSGAAATGFVAALFAVLGIIVVIALIVWIIGVIGQWKMFRKAGKEGWPAIIPIYNTYIQCKIVGVNPWWILIVFVCGIVGSLIPVIGSLISLAASIYFAIILCMSTANSYGKDTGWAIGLFFLQPFFMLALGVGKSTYVGEKPSKDPVMEFFKEKTGNNQSQPTQANASKEEKNENKKFCPNCGNEITIDTKYCPSCGKEL